MKSSLIYERIAKFSSLEDPPKPIVCQDRLGTCPSVVNTGSGQTHHLSRQARDRHKLGVEYYQPKTDVFLRFVFLVYRRKSLRRSTRLSWATPSLPTTPPGQVRRKRFVYHAVYAKNLNVCQDRLGTSIGKALKKEGRFLAAYRAYGLAEVYAPSLYHPYLELYRLALRTFDSISFRI